MWQGKCLLPFWTFKSYQFCFFFHSSLSLFNSICDKLFFLWSDWIFCLTNLRETIAVLWVLIRVYNKKFIFFDPQIQLFSFFLIYVNIFLKIYFFLLNIWALSLFSITVLCYWIFNFTTWHNINNTIECAINNLLCFFVCHFFVGVFNHFQSHELSLSSILFQFNPFALWWWTTEFPLFHVWPFITNPTIITVTSDCFFSHLTSMFTFSSFYLLIAKFSSS